MKPRGKTNDRLVNVAAGYSIAMLLIGAGLELLGHDKTAMMLIQAAVTLPAGLFALMGVLPDKTNQAPTHRYRQLPTRRPQLSVAPTEQTQGEEVEPTNQTS
ncbi:MAG: hypothetical protein EON58_19785 [Alphaproteobacteria bacterium]|nr:MAG: hypothetical protein EON58_19785 [Alphaproteobacteria bacterium]